VELSDRQLVVGFDERLVTYGADDLDALTLAYATTIHKAQGSEFPAVVIPVVPQHARVLRRSLLYTAVTRASRLAILVGCRATLSDAVARDESCRRWSRLDTWLREADREFC
jgi:exodeoxyribonuclease V alpha subunit